MRSQNHEQHERRWAPGTFLAALRAHVGNPAPFDYCLWLSLNPENDGTAIWVEKKFDMPNGGAWVSERVFSISLAAVAASRSPGLVVFECTPLHGVDDEIEKCVFFFCVCFEREKPKVDVVVGNIEFWTIVRGYGKLSRHFLKIDILFPRSCLFFGTRTILRRYLMICVIWYVTSRNTVPRTTLTKRHRLGTMKQKASQDLMGYFLCHLKQRTWTRNLGKC